MLMIRLSRTGRRNSPHFAIVVTEKTNPASDGNFVEKIGTYHPRSNPVEFRCERARVEYWTSKGAQISETLARLLHKQGVPDMGKFVRLGQKFQTKSKKAGAAPAPVAETPAA